MNTRLLAVLAAVSHTGLIVDALAQDALLEEVVVTASLRPVTALALPASVTVLEQGTLETAGVQHLQDVLPLVPNLNWASGSSRPRYFQLRGIGETDQWQGAPNPSVGFLIDGMDFSGIGMPSTLIDLAQVEVLRGPQGTTLGANALAGLINLQSRRPNGESERSVQWQAGEQGLLAAGVVLAGDFGAEAGSSDGDEADGWRFAVQRFREDGSRRNITLDRDDTNGLDETTVRWRSVHSLAQDWAADVSAIWVDQRNGFDAFAIDNGRVTRADDPGEDQQESRGISLVITREGGVAFRSLSAWVEADILYSFDGDWGADPDYDFTSRFLRDRRSLTQDFRWSSAPSDEDRRFAWVAGLYGLRVDEGNDQLDLFGGEVFRALISDYRADHLAAYGELSWRLATPWQLSLGVRAERRQSQYFDTDGSDLDPSEDMWGGNLSLEYASDERSRWYLTLARGYKAGGFNLGAVIPVAQREFGTEWLHSLEFGHKRVFADGRSSLSAALFYMRRGDQQVSTSAQLDPGDPLSFIYLTDNAARGANYGLEANWVTALGGDWQLSGSLGWLRASFKDYVTVDRDLTGRAQAHAPQWQGVMSLLYQPPSGWFARVDSQYQSGFFFSDSHDQRAGGRTLVNLRAGYGTGRWRSEVWIQNALDEDYAQRGFFFGNEPPDFPDRLYVQLADPRRAGVRFSWNFH